VLIVKKGKTMYNSITLIGTLVDRPQPLYDPDANKAAVFSLHVALPADAPATYWGLLFDLRGPEWTVGEEHFLVVCRNPALVEHCLYSLQKGDVVCVEGRLVVTLLNSEGTDVPLAEILAHKVIVPDAEKRSSLTENGFTHDSCK
jgi:single-stranded DNA-binding protein